MSDAYSKYDEAIEHLRVAALDDPYMDEIADLMTGLLAELIEKQAAKKKWPKTGPGYSKATADELTRRARAAAAKNPVVLAALQKQKP